MFIEFDVYGYVKKDDPLRSGGALLDIVDAVTRTNGPPPWGRGGFQDGDNLSTFFFHGFHIHQESLQGRVEHVCLQQSQQQAVHCQMDYIHKVKVEMRGPANRFYYVL